LAFRQHRTGLKELGGSHGRDKDQSAPQDVWIHRCGGRAERPRGVIFDIAQHVRPARIANDAKHGENADGQFIGKDIQKDADRGRNRSCKDQHRHQDAQLAWRPNAIHNQNKEQDAEQDFRQMPENVCSEWCVAHARDEGKDREHNKDQHSHRRDRRGECSILVGHDSSHPDKEDSAQRQVQKCWGEPYVNGQSRKRKQQDDADQHDQANHDAAQHQIGQDHAGDDCQSERSTE